MWKLIGLRELTAGSVQLFRQAGGCWQWKCLVWTSSELADEEIFDVRTPFFPQYRNYSGHDVAILRTKRDTGCVCPWSTSSTQYFLQALVSIFLFLLSRHIPSTSASENWHSRNTTRSILTDGMVQKNCTRSIYMFCQFYHFGDPSQMGRGPIWTDHLAWQLPPGTTSLVCLLLMKTCLYNHWSISCEV